MHICHSDSLSVYDWPYRSYIQASAQIASSTFEAMIGVLTCKFDSSADVSHAAMKYM